MLRYAHVSLTLASLIVAGGTGVARAAPSSPSPSPDSKMSAELKDAEGRTVGTVDVQDAGDGKSRVSVKTKDLPPGFHGLHVHDKGVCDASSTDPQTGSPFSDSGPHLGSGDHPQHKGDLPDLLVGKDGSADVSYVTDRVGVDELLGGEGSSLMVHEKPDNHGNIPERYKSNGKSGPDAETLKAGDSGSRIACAVLKQQN
ncbi:superoxide dismutase family protein [Thermopolyspora sp. NPDC052614]|uniref:superoxide dismutase family protein n=1 Tax=Thermopolyspora sp. NPDC052614 TaxID=3155682 RepID=UPI00342F609D